MIMLVWGIRSEAISGVTHADNPNGHGYAYQRIADAIAYNTEAKC